MVKSSTLIYICNIFENQEESVVYQADEPEFLPGQDLSPVMEYLDSMMFEAPENIVKSLLGSY